MKLNYSNVCASSQQLLVVETLLQRLPQTLEDHTLPGNKETETIYEDDFTNK